MGASASSTREDVPHFADLEPFFLSGVVKKPTRLGTGAYATVMELEVKGKKCAGKQLHSILLEEISPEEKKHTLSRFADECKLLQSIQHPNIVEFVGVYLERGCQVPCLVMECLDSTLTDYLDKQGVPDPPTYYSILSDVALGLRYLHHKSPPIVHRDLTANNVLLSSTLQAKISDLGVARVLNISPTTKSRMTKAPGTPSYMPPEALVDNPRYDTTIDCFSFGVLMIHTLSAKWPMPGIPNKVGNSGTLKPVTEFDRRETYVLQIGLNHPLMGLIRGCLQNYNKYRPNSSTILQEIVGIQANKAKEYLVCSSYTTRNLEYELGLTVGQEVTLLECQDNRRKVMLTHTQEVGYMPSHLLLRERKDCPTVIGVHDYNIGVRDQLSFQKGDVMYLINSEGERWFVVHEDTGMKGYVLQTYVTELLSKKRWFFGKMDCADVDSLLKQGPNTCGSFLLHSKAQGGYCLAVTGQGKEIKHHSIVESSGAFCIKNDVFFQTLQDLVRHYSQHPGLLGCTLVKPCVADYGPLQQYCCHDVEERGQVEGTMVVELMVGGMECLGGPTDVVLSESQPPECLYSKQLMFAEDCNLRKSIQHPNIVEFLGVYFKKESKVPYAVMECLHSTLSAHLEKNGAPEPSTSYSILSDVALGLCYLHKQSQPIVHGDLSAESILLSSTLKAKISDVKVASTLGNIPACQAHVLQPRSPLKMCYLPSEAHSQASRYDTSFDCFSFGVLVIHTLSASWPVPKDMDHDACLSSSNTPFMQRTEYIRSIAVNQRIREMVQNCLDDNPATRPNMSTIVKEIHHILEEQTSVKEYIAVSAHKATRAYELDAAIGDRFLIYSDSIRGLLKAQSVQTHELGYIPFHIVTEQQSHVSERKTDLRYRSKSVLPLTGHEDNTSSSSLPKPKSPILSLLPTSKKLKKSSASDSKLSYNMGERQVSTSSTSPSIVLTPPHESCHESVDTSASKMSFTGEEYIPPSSSIIPTSEVGNEGRGLSSEMSFNMEELLKPLEKSTLYTKVKRLQPSSEIPSDPAATQHAAEAPSTQSCPELYVGKYDYRATDSDQLSFKKGDLMKVLSKDGKWWCAEMQSTGERGKVPSNFVVEKNSLDAEEWFFRTLQRNKAERILMRDYNSCGSFLVRESQSNPGLYSISIRGEKNVSHYLIEKEEGGTWSLTDGDRFQSIPQLIAHYSKQTGVLCARLQAPCLIEEPLSMKIEKATYECELDRRDVRLLHKVRQGRFGEVWEGEWKRTTTVAVVTIKSSSKSPQEMILEAAHMKKLDHPYVVRLIGASTEEEPMYAVIELPKHGDLLTYLKRRGKLLGKRELIDMAIQIAGGMAYLEEQNFTHQNLAARNVLLGEDVTCKVANFGLAQACDEEDAIRWRAPEVIKHKRFTIKSDVWSFGIVLYEIITYSQLPYPRMTANEVCNALQSNYRMPQPSGCPDKLYSLMLNCWAEEPGNRLGFENQMFQLTKLTKYHL